MWPSFGPAQADLAGGVDNRSPGSGRHCTSCRWVAALQRCGHVPLRIDRTPANRPRSQGTPGEEETLSNVLATRSFIGTKATGEVHAPSRCGPAAWGAYLVGNITEPDQTDDRDRTLRNLGVAGCGPGAPPPWAVVLDGARLVADRLRGGFVNDQLVAAFVSTGVHHRDYAVLPYASW